ncbi:MAG: flagellar biosynthesis protein FlhB [Paenibacillaceae bacterium]
MRLTVLRLRVDLQLFAQEKTEQATPKKKADERKKGQVAKSQELPGAFILFFSFLFLYMFGSYFKDRMYRLFTVSFNEYMLWDISVDNVTVIFGDLLLNGFFLLLPILVGTVIIAILGNYLQIGFLLTGDPLMMKFSKLNPIAGAKRIFSLRSLVEFLKSLLKLTIVAFVCYSTIIAEKDSFLALSKLPLEGIFTFTAKIAMILGLKIGGILVALALFDYMYQKYDYEKNLKMSKQDIKDEYKKSEGDPLIKGKIREKQRRMALQRMMQDVPKADVVITNPTHYAVALRYDAKEMESPVVIAKGQDYIALKIKEVAAANNITLMENKPLARALYAQVEIGQTVPSDLFQAVAEVLAYVYRLKRKA